MPSILGMRYFAKKVVAIIQKITLAQTDKLYYDMFGGKVVIGGLTKS